VSLCNLLLHLDRGAYRPVVAFSRAEQQDYVLRHCDAPLISTVIPGGKSLRLSRALRIPMTRLANVAPRLGRPLLTGLALVDHLALTLPYALRLRSFARAHHIECIQHNNGFDMAAIFLAWSLRVPLTVYQRGDEWNSRAVRYLSRRVDMFIANSQATRQSLLSIGIPAGRIRVIYPPVDFARFDSGGSCATQRAEFRVADSEPCFGIVGALRERKGHRVFLRAAARVIRALPSARAFIIGEAGPRDAAYKEELVALAAKLGIADRVVFTGFRNDVSQLIQLLDVVVHASVRPEPFGRVIVEAMAMKKPVIASSAGGPLEIIQHGQTGFLTLPGDDGQLSEHILKLLTERELAAEIANRGYRAAEARFSVSGHVALMQALYAELLTAAQSRASLDRSRLRVAP
jgi:glycosyltransferase involved in cell wall biosynthesis